MRAIGIIVLATALMAALAGEVESHGHLAKSLPAANSSGASPKEIILHFNENIEPQFSRITLKSSSGWIAPGSAKGDSTDRTLLILKLAEPLAPDRYEVVWKIVSVDTHVVRGSFAFEVKP